MDIISILLNTIANITLKTCIDTSLSYLSVWLLLTSITADTEETAGAEMEYSGAKKRMQANNIDFQTTRLMCI